MPPLPAEKLRPSPTGVKLEAHCHETVSCAPGTLCRASASKDAAIGELCRVCPAVLGHEVTAITGNYRKSVQRLQMLHVGQTKCNISCQLCTNNMPSRKCAQSWLPRLTLPQPAPAAARPARTEAIAQQYSSEWASPCGWAVPWLQPSGFW